MSAPVKFNKYQLKTNLKSGEQEQILNKRTRIEEQKDSETDLDFKPVETTVSEAKESSVEQVLKTEINSLVNVSSRITFNDSIETLKVKGGKTITKQEAL